MDLSIFYYIVLGVTVISYLLGLFLSYFEKKGRVSVLSSMGNVGFVNIYGVNVDPPVQQEQPAFMDIQKPPVEEHPVEVQQEESYMDPEII